MDGLRDSLLALGIPGLFLIAFLDSAGIPLPGGVDVVVLLLAWQQPSLFVWIALAASTGSTLGCLVLYRLGRTGGDRAVRRLDPGKREWVTRKVRENDVVAMLVAVLAPPPFPAKVFMLVAGIVGMSWTRFAAAIFVGRMIRFSGEAYLAVRLGDRAVETLQAHYPTVGGTLALAVILYLAVKWVRKRRRLPAAG
jgi:membrane protein YqaA with SNARE-associated domain